MQAAIDELTETIRASYPEARFDVRAHPEESSTTLLEATVDVEDVETVLDLVFDRMEHLRIDEGLPILVVPLQTPERVAAMISEARARMIPGFPTAHP